MRPHLATYSLTRTYRHFRPLEGRPRDEVLQEALAHHAPRPWDAGWRRTSTGGMRVVDNDTALDGVALTCDVSWEIDLPVWESDHVKAKKQAQIEAENFTKGYGAPAPGWMSPGNWNGRTASTAVISLKAMKEDKRLRRRFAIPWRTLASFDQSWWPSPYEIDQAFEAFRAIAGTAARYERKCRWHTPKTHDLLSNWRDAGDHSAFNSVTHALRPIESLKDLRTRFQAAILGTNETFYDDWRRDNGYALDATLEVDAAHYGSTWRKHVVFTRKGATHLGTSLQDALRELLEGSRGLTLSPQLNSMHKGANIIGGIGVEVSKSGFRFLMSYGYEGSSWTEEIARTRHGEPFMETLARAYRLFHEELVPDYEEQMDGRRKNAERCRLKRLGLRFDEAEQEDA